MEQPRGPQYRSALLPWEQQFCEALDISADDYFAYYELVTQHVEEEKNRELIPDIRNEPVTIITLVVGLALSAVGMLLAPKPRTPEQQQKGDPFQAQDVRGRTKYAPLAEFDSVQDLATLGTIVPLLYTLQQGNHGGVRAESQLMWSRMRNLATYQELRALLLFSAGELDDEPDFEGFAFGNNKISGYMAAKLALWFVRGLSSENGNQPIMNDGPGSKRYSEATRFVYGPPSHKQFYTSQTGTRKMTFCGVTTPSQTAAFGQYSPIRNGHAWKYDFKYPGKGDGDAESRDTIYGTRRKHVTGYHAGYTTLTGSSSQMIYRIWDEPSDEILQASSDASNPEIQTKLHFDSRGKLLVQRTISENDSAAEKIGGVTEGVTAIQKSQVDADVAIDVGELYLIGSDIYNCTRRSNQGASAGTPFEPDQSGSIEYTFTRDDEFKKGYVSSSDIQVNSRDYAYDERHIPIQKVSVGAISTTRKVDYVEIGFKSTVYRQVNGYPNIAQFSYKDIADEYAKNLQTWQPGSITAYYDRVSLFRLEIKRGSGSWYDWNGDKLFAVHGNNPQSQYNQFYIELPAKDFYEFRFIPVCGNAWIANGNYDDKEVYLLNSRKGLERSGDSSGGYRIRVKGEKTRLTKEFNMEHPYWATGEKEPRNQNPNSLLNDYWFFDADTASHENEPEHVITWINEYVENDSAWYANENKQYEHLAYSGLICQSSKEISTFSNFSAYFKQGLIVRKLVDEASRPYGACNLFPEVAYDLLTNRRYGVGEYIGNNAIDLDRFRTAAEFCRANGFYWDGLISQKLNIRQFLFEQSAYQLLDFTILGGLFSLYPAVPFNSDHSIDFEARAGDNNFQIRALFTDGNVRNFKTTFLSPEERQLFIAELKFREEEKNGFPETRTLRLRLSENEGGYSRDPVELFDMTQFCTTREHAVAFAKYALRVRQLVDHSVSFETTPDAAHNLSPGDYVRVGVSVMHQDKRQGYSLRLRTGSVAPDGTLQINKSTVVDPNGFEVYYWKPGFTSVREGLLIEQDGKVQNAALYGSLFTRKRTSMEVRVYKIESIAYSEESFVEISGSYVPLQPDGRMKVLDWDDTEFVVEDI